MGSVLVEYGLSCPEACGIKSVSPALAGRFFTTGPPRKSKSRSFLLSRLQALYTSLLALNEILLPTYSFLGLPKTLF